MCSRGGGGARVHCGCVADSDGARQCAARGHTSGRGEEACRSAGVRVAATLLVIATGTLVVFRNGGREAQIATTIADTASNATAPSTIEAVPPAAPPVDQTMKATAEAAPSLRIKEHFSQPAPLETTRPTTGSTGKSVAKGVTTDASTAAQGLAAPAPQAAQELAAPAPPAAYRGKELSAASQPNIPLRENKAVAYQRGGAVADEQLPLKVVGTPRTLGAKVTLYEVAPGDTVTLREELNVRLEAVVVTGASTAPQARRSTEKSAAAAQTQRADAAVVSAADSQRSVSAAGALSRTPSAPAPVARVEVADGVTTIHWVDATTGNMLRLSGRMPEARLQQVKTRLERERAAAAASTKKNP